MVIFLHSFDSFFPYIGSVDSSTRNKMALMVDSSKHDSFLSAVEKELEESAGIQLTTPSNNQEDG